ncbi:MAG: 16S rRNA (guanine(966)-N(2))-methyltransferase RsmD [Duncaniella sp.]|nr:16S rRNA (guanine(966)-N(2))-methyltransferase RsmD [Duncaniella sp.]
MRIIRGKYGRRRFNVPTNITARPTTDFARENIFNVIENLTDIEGARCLDLFAGTGAVSIEFLSRGAASVTSVEKSPIQARFIEKVARELGDTNLRLRRTDAVRFIRDGGAGPYDIVFADPPYDMDGFGDIPGAVLESGMLAPGALFVMEHSKAYNFSHLPHYLQHRAYGSVNFSLFQVPSVDAVADDGAEAGPEA